MRRLTTPPRGPAVVDGCDVVGGRGPGCRCSRTRGMVMVLAPCSSGRAWDLLVEVSQHCKVELRDLAAALVATTKGQELPEAIRREWPRALRRLHALERR